MKSFVFTLARMRNYKSQLLDKEKNTLAALRRRQQEVETRIASLEQYAAETERRFHQKQQSGITVQEMNAFRFYLENITSQLKELRVDLKLAEAESERQLKVVIVASQDVSALDKLEERQKEEYQQLVLKDNAQTIEEYVSSQMIRAQQRA